MGRGLAILYIAKTSGRLLKNGNRCNTGKLLMDKRSRQDVLGIDPLYRYFKLNASSRECSMLSSG